MFVAWRRPVGGLWLRLGEAATEADAWQLCYAAMTEPRGAFESIVLPAGQKPKGRIAK